MAPPQRQSEGRKQPALEFFTRVTGKKKAKWINKESLCLSVNIPINKLELALRCFMIFFGPLLSAALCSSSLVLPSEPRAQMNQEVI